MKLIKSKYEIIFQEKGLEGMYKNIEKAGRLCYASDPVEGKAKDFVDKLMRSNHLSVLEHGTVYLKIDADILVNNRNGWEECYIGECYAGNKYSKRVLLDGYSYISTNLRVLVENDWLDDLQYLCEPTEYHIKRISVLFNAVSLGIAREIMRHRSFSFSQRSTRYCNYNNWNKFGEHMEFILPTWCNLPLGEYFEGDELTTWCPDNIDFDSLSCKERIFISSLIEGEAKYHVLIHQKCKPQEARDILPLALNAPMMMTGFIDDWKHFFSLRALGITGKPHPDCVVLTKPLMETFKKLNLML